MTKQNEIKKLFEISRDTIEKSESLGKIIEQVGNKILVSLQRGKKIIIFGNGGSAADAQHMAAELIGKYLKERKSYPAIALTTDSSILTALGNDYNFDIVFCSNVLLHLPSIDLALKNLLKASKKYCIIRTLVSDNTHLSKFYHNDKTNKNNILDT